MGALHMTSNTTPGPYVASASSEILDNPDPTIGGGAAYRVFDGDVNYAWHANSSAAWVQIDFGPSLQFKLFGYTIGVETFANALFPGRDPLDWTIEGSNNGTDWDVLDTVTGQNWGSFFNDFSLPTRRDYVPDVVGVGYRFLRLNVSANHGDPTTEVGSFDFGGDNYGFQSEP